MQEVTTLKDAWDILTGVFDVRTSLGLVLVLFLIGVLYRRLRTYEDREYEAGLQRHQLRADHAKARLPELIAASKALDGILAATRPSASNPYMDGDEHAVHLVENSEVLEAAIAELLRDHRSNLPGDAVAALESASAAFGQSKFGQVPGVEGPDVVALEGYGLLVQAHTFVTEQLRGLDQPQ